MDRFEVTFNYELKGRPNLVYYTVYALNFGDALEKGITEFKEEFTRFSPVYKVSLRKFSEDLY